MGSTREKKLRKQAREAREEAARQEKYHDEVLNILAVAYKNVKLAESRIVWLESCIEEFQKRYHGSQIVTSTLDLS